MTNRLFISAEIPDEIKDKVISIRKNIYEDDHNVRWEKKDKLHFTLKFLGDVEQSKTPQIISELESILKNYKEITCSFIKFGIFKKGNLPSILWLGINYNKELNEIAETISNNFQKLGFEKEKRKFKPHLTLLRIKGKEDFDKINDFVKYDLQSINFKINEISLMKSELLRSGSVYTKIKVFKLNK